MVPRVTQRQTQDLDNSGDKGDDTGQNCQEAHEEAIWVESLKQPSSCQTDQRHESSHAEPERDTFEPLALRSSFPQWYPSIARDGSTSHQLLDGHQRNLTHPFT